MLRREDLITELQDHRNRIQEAIEILKSGTGYPRRKDGKRGRRRLSAAARKKISAGQKRRWAAARQVKEKQRET